MKKIILFFLSMLLLLPAMLKAEVIEEKDFAVIVPPGFTYKSQIDGYNNFGTADGRQRIDINVLSELVAGTNAAFILDNICKQQGYVQSKDYTSRKEGRFCAMGRDGKSFVMVLSDKKGLKICVVIYRWTSEYDAQARQNIPEYFLKSYSLDRSLHQNSTSSGKYQNIGGGN